MGADLTLRLDSLPVRRNEDRGHHAERAVALSDGVRLDVAVVVLASPHEAAFGLHGLWESPTELVF